MSLPVIALFLLAPWTAECGIAVEQVLAYVGNHIALSVCAPIAIVESMVGVGRRHEPWLSRPGLAVVGVFYVGGSLLIYSDTAGADPFTPTPGRAIRPLWVGLVVAVAHLAIWPSGWTAVAIRAALGVGATLADQVGDGPFRGAEAAQQVDRPLPARVRLRLGSEGQHPTQHLGREHRLACGDPADGARDLLRWGVLEQESAGADAQRLADVLVGVERGQDDDLRWLAAGA